MLINSSIPEDQNVVLAKIRDQLPLLVSNIRLASQAEEENMKKLESRKADLDEVTKLKAKFEVAEAKLEDGMKVADMAISFVSNQAMEKEKAITSTKVEARKWSTLVSKAQRDKETTKWKWTALKNQLDFL